MTNAAHDKGPLVKGWCPGAYRPMVSGDGLVVRVRPQKSRLNRDQVLALAALAIQFGNGVIDLTSRGNLQIRGVAQDDYTALLRVLMEASLLDATPEDEARRNILTTPFWGEDDLTERLYQNIVAGLASMPELPAKMGIVLDTGDVPVLTLASGDFRFERGADTPLILRADGAETGVAVTSSTALAALSDLAEWFVASSGCDVGRMHRHVRQTALPERFQGAAARSAATPPEPGSVPEGCLLGAAFGALDAQGLIDLFADPKARGMRCTPWRLFLLEGVASVSSACFVTQPDAGILNVHACPGAPRCAQAQVETRGLARALAASLPQGQSLHVSGCAKGCAHAARADVTLVGSAGKFDLVRQGTAWDEPSARGLSSTEILKELTQ